jgi:hypothetical protein
MSIKHLAGLVLAGWLAAGAAAQPNAVRDEGPNPDSMDFPDDPDSVNGELGPGEPGRPPPPGFPPGRPFRQGYQDAPFQGPPGRRPVERWLERLRQGNPQEFERLQKLRRDDPPAFHQEMINRLDQEQFQMRLRDVPKVHDFLMNLPPEERRAALERLRGLGEDGEPIFQRPGARPDPEMQPLEEELRRLSGEYREAPSARQEQIRSELRLNLNKLFDIRNRQQQQRVADFEQRLTSLRQAMEKRQELREQIIERRLQELTEGDALRW